MWVKLHDLDGGEVWLNLASVVSITRVAEERAATAKTAMTFATGEKQIVRETPQQIFEALSRKGDPAIGHNP